MRWDNGITKTDSKQTRHMTDNEKDLVWFINFRSSLQSIRSFDCWFCGSCWSVSTRHVLQTPLEWKWVMSFPRALHQMHCSPRMRSFTKTWKRTDWLFKENPRFISDVRSDLFHLYYCEREKKEHENKRLQVSDSEINVWKSQLIVTVGKPLANGLVSCIWPRRGNDCTVRVYN